MLRRYDTIIIDEAHERSLNIDFLLGYLKQLLPRRPDLKVIITSATIDTERFSEHFGGAPVVEVSGRTYPVEVRYRPVDRPRRRARPTTSATRSSAISDAVDELLPNDRSRGDILVFLSGEREIRDTAEALRRTWRATASLEILPLYARLSAAEQHRVFAPAQRPAGRAGDQRRRDLADRARASVRRRPRHRAHLALQPPAQGAAAADRAGLPGLRQPAGGPLRPSSDGICIRLYAEEDFLARPEFTEPEILRTNLASVILQMTGARPRRHRGVPLRRPAGPPSGPRRRRPARGARRLRPGAARPGQAAHRRSGGKLARLPVDPRLGRMVSRPTATAACARCWSSPPRCRSRTRASGRWTSSRRPTSSTAASPTTGSDFLAYLNLWDYLQEQQKALVRQRVPAACAGPSSCTTCGSASGRTWSASCARSPGRSASHDGRASRARRRPAAGARSLLAGLLSHVGLWEPEKREYLGARGARFALWPGSALFRKPPRWVMAAELVETSRLWGRDLGRIEPEWVEPLAEHLVKRTYSEPHWSAKHGAVDGVRAGHALRRAARRRTAGSPTAGSTRSCPASCSSGTRWWRASGAPTTGSSTTTGRCSRTSRSSSTGPGAATSWSTTRRSSPSTTQRVPADVVSGAALRRMVEEGPPRDSPTC